MKAPRASYRPDPNWPVLPPGFAFGAVCGVSVHPDGSVFVLHRGPGPVRRFSPEGRLLASWGDGLIKLPHTIKADHTGMVWVTDVGNHVVYQFTPEGEVLRVLGQKGEAGDRLDQFNQPTDVAVAPSGEFFVSDGYGNNRVLKFDRKGGLIRTWGQKGREPGQFDCPHALGLSPDCKLYVSDRSNSRIQVFSGDGVFETEWRSYPYVDGIHCSGDGDVWVSTGRENGVLRIGPDGWVKDSFGGLQSTEDEIQANLCVPLGRFNVAHALSLDAAGNLYVAEVRSRRIQRWALVNSGSP